MSLAVDIDETISATVHKWIEILTQNFGRAEEDLTLTVDEMVEKYSFTQNVPYWQTADARNWMLNAIKDPELHLGFDLMPGAEVMVQIHSASPIKYYWSTRPEIVGEATVEWLKMKDLPVVDLILRPNHIPVEQGNSWKVDQIVKRYPEVQGVIDNSGDVISKFPSDYPGVIFHYGAFSAARTDIRVIPCPSWDDVAREVARVIPRVISPQP